MARGFGLSSQSRDEAHDVESLRLLGDDDNNSPRGSENGAADIDDISGNRAMPETGTGSGSVSAAGEAKSAYSTPERKDKDNKKVVALKSRSSDDSEKDRYPGSQERRREGIAISYNPSLNADIGGASASYSSSFYMSAGELIEGAGSRMSGSTREALKLKMPAASDYTARRSIEQLDAESKDGDRRDDGRNPLQGSEHSHDDLNLLSEGELSPLSPLIPLPQQEEDHETDHTSDRYRSIINFDAGTTISSKDSKSVSATVTTVISTHGTTVSSRGRKGGPTLPTTYKPISSYSE
jgi:hypothetical protein